MSACCRGLLLALALFGLILGQATGQRADAQQPQQFRPGESDTGKHRIWLTKPLSAEDIRQALVGFGQGNKKADDDFLELLKQAIRQQNPKASPEEVDDAAKKLMTNKEFRDRLADALQKHKNDHPEQWKNGQPPRITHDDIAQWAQVKPNGNDDPLKLPRKEVDPRTLPPFNPKNPNFDPEKFPAIDPEHPPEFDPKTGLPRDRRTGKPFDPRSGKPLEPEDLQPFNPKNPNFDPQKFPAIDPKNPPKFDRETGLPIDEDGNLFNPRNGQKIDSRDAQPFNPKSPLFDPERFPAVNPKEPPDFDPRTGFPRDPNTRRPIDPRNGRPIDPRNPPKIKPVPDAEEPPPVQPNILPNPQQPPAVRPEMPPIDNQLEPDVPNNNRQFDPNNPLGGPPQDKDQAAKNKAVDTATAIWEKNVGPIDESPAVKKAIIDLVGDPDTRQMMTDEKGNSIFESMQKEGSGGAFDDWLKGDGNWEWPKWNFGSNKPDTDGPDNQLGGKWRDNDWGGDRNRWRQTDHSRDIRSGDSSSSGMGSLDIGGLKVPLLGLLILFLAIVAGVIAYRFRSLFQPKAGELAIADGGSGWPVDPRDINTREDVVKVFEYLSVMLCGASAKTWTHSTIADQLSELASTEPETALKLARLYELARYAPLDEPLTRTELLEARRLACDLAGIDEV